MSLLLASGNAHKLEEISAVLGIPLRGLRDVPDAPELIEDGDSFEANARIKAEGLARHCGEWALADDSGLDVSALGGAPGIHSARFAGRHGDDAANNALLLSRLEGQAERGARFVCVIALCSPEGECHFFRGECPGHIAHAASGRGGFGYDPLFIPQGFSQSFAELGSECKNRISHRAKALAGLRQWLQRPQFQAFTGRI